MYSIAAPSVVRHAASTSGEKALSCLRTAWIRQSSQVSYMAGGMSRSLRLWRSARRGMSAQAGLDCGPWAATDIAQKESATTRVCRLKSVLANFWRISSDESMKKP